MKKSFFTGHGLSAKHFLVPVQASYKCVFYFKKSLYSGRYEQTGPKN